MVGTSVGHAVLCIHVGRFTQRRSTMLGNEKGSQGELFRFNAMARDAHIC